MARNEEKANTMLRKFMDAKAERLGLAKEKRKRPALATECKDLSEADKWRAQVGNLFTTCGVETRAAIRAAARW